MAFPTTAILDNYNRADAQPPSANWSDDPAGDGTAQLQIISNECAPDTVSTMGSGYWNAATFTGDSEVHCVIPVVGSSAYILFLHLSSPGATFDSYVLYYTGGVITIVRYDDGASTTLDAYFQSLSDGDAIGLELSGTTLTAYYKASGGSWASLGSVTDSTYTTGYVGLEFGGDAASRVDDFGGGEISSADASHNVSDSATLTDTASVSASFSISDSLTLSDSATLAASFSLSDSAALDDSASLAASFSLSDSLAVSDTAALESAYSLSDSLTLTESISIEVQLSASDAFTFSDTASLAAALSASDSLTLSDSASVDVLFTGNLGTTNTYSAVGLGRELTSTHDVTQDARDLGATVTSTQTRTHTARGLKRGQ